MAEQSGPPSMKMIPPDASVEGAGAPGFSESTFLPTVSKIPDFNYQAGLNYGYGLIQSMLGNDYPPENYPCRNICCF